MFLDHRCCRPTRLLLPRSGDAHSGPPRYIHGPEDSLGRYVQKVSLVPFCTTDVWIGWDLEGVEGEVTGLLRLDGLAPDQLEQVGALEFQEIPAAYLSDFMEDKV